MHQYFRCGFRQTRNDLSKVNFRRVTVTDENENRTEIEFGHLMWKNLNSSKPLLAGIDSESIFSDLGSVWEENKRTICYFGSMHGLQALLDSAPSPTFVLFTRNSATWAADLHSENNLMGRLSQACGDSNGFPHVPVSPSDRTQADIQKWIEFYESHMEAVRSFAAANPSLNYIEIDLENDPANQLEQKIGIPASCWPGA